MDGIAIMGAVSPAQSETRESVRLSSLPAGSNAVVVSVGARREELSVLERRLLELGFISGEQVQVLAEARPGGDPIVVRVGCTTLALRRREVECVWVTRTDGEP
jgi:ferrous iron transport protein A